MRFVILLITLCFYGCTLTMPLPTDLSKTDLKLDYKCGTIKINDARPHIDTIDLITPKVSFLKKLIKISPPLTNNHKDSIEYL